MLLEIFLSLLIPVGILYVYLRVKAQKQSKPSPVYKDSELGIKLLIHDSIEEVERWQDNPSTYLDYEKGKQVKPNQLVVGGFLLSGFQGNGKHQYDVSAGFAIFDPSGTPIMAAQDFSKKSGVLEGESIFTIGENVLNFTLDNTDPEGEYKILAEVVDLVSQKTAKTEFFFNYSY